MYAMESASFRDELAAALGVDWSLELFGSTTLNSRVIWPAPLRQKPLFAFTPVQGRGLLGRIKMSLAPEIEFRFSQEVANYLTTLSNKAL